MKTFIDVYKFPLKKYMGTAVYDDEVNFVFQFEPQYYKGKHANGWEDFEKKILSKINGGYEQFEHEFKVKEGQIFYKNIHVMTIRGWGNLTGVGGHNLSAKEAANIQDSFANFIVEQLNKE